jgi:hypothetical protein
MGWWGRCRGRRLWFCSELPEGISNMQEIQQNIEGELNIDSGFAFDSHQTLRME